MAKPKTVLMKNPIQLPWNTTESAADEAVDLVTEVDDGFEAEVEKPDFVVVAGEGDELELPVGDERGAVDCPLISLRIEALKVPVISSRVNLAEKAKAGYWG